MNGRKVVRVEVAPIDYLATVNVVTGPGGQAIEQKQAMRDYHLVALCDDGSVWRFGLNGAQTWTRLPDVPAVDHPDTGIETSAGAATIEATEAPATAR